MIKNWIKKLLGIIYLEQRLRESESKINSLQDNIKNDRNRIKELEKRIVVGADYNPFHDKGESWAVICIKGKPEYVQFVDLRGADIHVFSRFLAGFRRENATIDVPFGFKQRFNEF